MKLSVNQEVNELDTLLKDFKATVIFRFFPKSLKDKKGICTQPCNSLRLAPFCYLKLSYRELKLDSRRR